MTTYFIIIAMIFARTESIHRGDFISISTAPYFVSFVATEQHLPYCGGAIISEYWILSAAHCMKIIRAVPSAAPIQIRAGSTHRSSNGDIHEVEKVFIYGDYESASHVSENIIGFNDIALFKLKIPIAFDEFKQPIKVNSQLPNNLSAVTIIGIGQESPKKPSESLKAASVVINSQLTEDVNRAMPNVFVIQGFGPEICPGDSGSPAVLNGELIGALSGGSPCAARRKLFNTGVGIYTRTDRFYHWIMQLTGIKY